MNAAAANFSLALSQLPLFLGQHVLLALSSLGLGLAISLPLAIAAARIGWLRGPALATASVIQTIPGLALLALFYPILLALSAFTMQTFGVGFRALGFLPALLALTLYAMLPILRNTVIAIEGIDATTLQAARAVGMTPTQSLLRVELPLAAPVIMAGIRTAAVWVIGTATLSTPVGQTSLGNYIFTGLQTENWIFVLFGCGAAAALALAVDRALGLAESGFSRRSPRRLIGAAAAMAVILAAGLPTPRQQGRASIVVGTKNFEEQYILGALLEQRLRAAGLPTTRRDGLGSSILFHALAANDVDVYVDYAGTIWTNQMHRTDQPGREAMLAEMTAWLKQRHGITLLARLGFENAYTLAMRPDSASRLGVTTLTDLARVASGLSIGGDYEFFGRPDWAATAGTYGLHFARMRQYQSNFLYKAVRDGDVDVISAFSSDGRIAQYGLRLLADPLSALPPYDAVILLSPRLADAPELRAALAALRGAISLETMQHANLMVDQEHDKASPEAAATWLNDQLR